MIGWEPKEKSPIGAPDDDFTQAEAAQWWGLALDEWELKSVDARARMLAHYLHRNAREAWVAEKIRVKHEPKKPDNAFERMQRAMRERTGMTR